MDSEGFVHLPFGAIIRFDSDQERWIGECPVCGRDLNTILEERCFSCSTTGLTRHAGNNWLQAGTWVKTFP